jgi:hypothetical protein
MPFKKKADVILYDRITARRASTSGAISAGCVTSADCRAVWAMDGGGCAPSSRMAALAVTGAHAAIPMRLGLRGELRPFNAHIGAAPVQANALTQTGIHDRLGQHLRQVGANRLGQRDMGHRARAKKVLSCQKKFIRISSLAKFKS